MTETLTPLAAIRARIDLAARAAGRDPASVRLVAVSKTQPVEAIARVWDGGHRIYGENRVQEAAGRWSDRRTAGEPFELRLIGPLQTNKVREAVALFDAIDTLDREKLAAALAETIQKTGRSPEILVQVNTGEEPQKAGVLPADADAFLKLARERYDLPVSGLMCIPPEGEPAGPHFALLAKIAARNGLTQLSMGMSGDFESAIRFGATMVRVGSALFGERSY